MPDRLESTDLGQIKLLCRYVPAGTRYVSSYLDNCWNGTMMSWSHLPIDARIFRAALIFCLLLTVVPTGARGQAPPSGISPQVIRERLKTSGLTPDEIRERLRGAGYSADLLDSYLSTETSTASTKPGDDLAAALSILNVLPFTPEGLAPVDTLPVTDNPHALFGLDVFQRATTQFQPMLTGPVPTNYRLGPGDVLVLVLTGDVELVHTLEVTRDGFVLIPQVGQLYVNTLTMDQLRNSLYDRLSKIYSGVKRDSSASTRFDVTVASLRSNQIFVIGEVARPSAYQLSSVATVLNALYAAGGPTERGNFRQVEVRRHGKLHTTLDLYDYLLHGDTRNDIILDQGDVVFVPVHGTRATIKGAVLRPAIYELRQGETLADLVDAAGGFRPAAALDRISISRIAPPAQRRVSDSNRIIVDVPLTGADSRKAAPFVIEPGDEVTVFALPNAKRAYVELNGHVYAPGTFGWKEGLRLSELIRLAGGFRPATYAGAAHIERLNRDDATPYILDIRLPADSTLPFPDDILLQEYDIVTIYGREEFRSDRTISIAGMVNEPGTFQYREGMTLRDLVLMARGLRDGALLDSAEIARIPEARSPGQLTVRLRVPLDSTYLFEPESSSYRFLPGLNIPSRSVPDIALYPFDHVLIFKQPEFELQRMVKITGEVAFPGTYALSRKDEKISDLIQRAGGILPTGYVAGSSLQREFGNAGPVDINLEAILKRTGGREDIVLFPGDLLHIPEYNPVVRVVGQVNSPTSVQFKPGAGLEYYISNAGGYTREADKGRVSVRFANGQTETKHRSLVLFHSTPTPLPGSVITVPAMRPDDKTDWPGIIGPITQIVGSIGTLIIVLTRLK